ncbi:hypothetical protein PtA15_7A379 [Puccinia triticina]|uniref:GRIP domain-containing protein n=1 Tax=Puccinia triticina TaxID=208348 RepID=A0ABY7CVB6_9BASI|nr:uncharacterized protein PtA15_7A379 [Puccinia triticina]WAQ86652.1 hypothetical protein PtA15_7A379 [Puccinia triticina]WAR56516.1 hypothetical protein PtB15_7B365 [Puccinia triticina]
MAENIPLPDSPAPSSSAHNPAENNQHIEAEPPALDAIIQALLPILSGQNTLLALYQTLNELAQKADTPLTDPTSQLLNSLAERHDQLDRLKVCDASNPANSIDHQLKPDQPPPPDPPDETKAQQEQSRQEIEALKTELETTQAKLKQEEEKRAKSISLLRAVRQKLVQTEKDKNALESELNESNSNSSSKIKELQADKKSLEDELSKLKISQEQQLSKLRHSYERENQSIRSQFERETASKKSQFELDTITAKAAYERELTNRNQKIVQTEARLRDLSAERDRLFEQLQNRQAELEDTRAQHDDLKGSVDELQHELTQSQNRVHVLCEEIEQLVHKQGSTLESDQVIQMLKEQHLHETKTLETRIAQLEKERIDVENELGESLKERLEQIEHLRNQARLKSIEYHDSLTSMAQRNQEILKSDAQIDLLKTQLKAALLARDSQTDSIASLKQQLEELQTELKTATEELTRTRVELEEGSERERMLRAENKSLRENEIRKVDEVKGLFMRGNIEQNVRKEGVGYFAHFSQKPPAGSAPLPATPATTRDPALGSDPPQPDLSTHAPAPSCSPSPHASHIPPTTPPPPQSSTLVDPDSSSVSLDNPALDDEAQLNFEYLRNTLLQFLEHKEMRPHLVRVLGVILHFTPQEIRRLASKV